jgi:succinate-semialdehyde dehydrogenase/glutarate-semialdehyde dehydrogenase
MIENGKTLAEAEGEVEYSTLFITWFIEEVVWLYRDIIPSRYKGSTNLIIYQPTGIYSIITPWNFPITIIIWKLVPIIAAGYIVVIKPPSKTLLYTLALTALAI